MSIDERLRDGLSRNGWAIAAAVEAELEAVQRRRRGIVRRRVAGGFAVVASLAALVPWVFDGLRPTPDPAPPSETSLAGTYLFEASVAGTTGEWRASLTDDGVLRLVGPPRFELGTEHEYSLDDGVFRTNAFIDYPGCQRPGSFVGRYTWEQDGPTLTFSPIQDRCAPRRALLAVPWEEQE